jgi:hypothetical protein
MSQQKERINLAVSPETRSKIEDIQKRLDLGSLTEVIRRGVSVLDILSEHQKEGYSLTLSKGKEKITIKLI